MLNKLKNAHKGDCFKAAQAVIFDMDGVMFDTERIAVASFVEAGRDTGIEIQPEDIIAIIGLNLQSAELKLKERFGEDFPFHSVNHRRMLHSNQYIGKNGIPVKPGLHALLEFLKHIGMRMAVATSTQREATRRYLSMTEIEGYFDVVVCGDEISNGKPEPDIFLKAAHELGCNPKNCIVLEDSENGLLAASRAGMIPILIPDMKRPSAEVLQCVYGEYAALHGFMNALQAALGS